MYGRTVGDRVLEFGHQGMLYRQSFVMYDKQTESLWLHVTGEALKGPLKGTRLGFLPSEVVPWGEWRRRHPETLVLLGQKARGLMGTFALSRSTSRYGLSVGSGREVRLYPFELLEAVPVVNGDFQGGPLVVTWHAPSLTAAAFAARLDGRTLHFDAVLSGQGEWMRDAETGGLWSRARGECLSGPLAGRQLERLPAVPWLVQRWRGFFPRGDVAPPLDAPGAPEPDSEG